ncbi:MAG: hypothetical protein OXH57_08705, partial [Ekhidna sp.]|nr:hypothetical protein [Ekhidna sp.]
MMSRINYKSHRLYWGSYKVGVMLDLVMNWESDAFIACKHGLRSGFICRMRKELLEEHDYLRILA